MTDRITAAWRAWHAALDLLADHRNGCDLYATSQQCAGCALLLSRETAAYADYYAMRHGEAAA
jgi:hypothetical protein